MLATDVEGIFRLSGAAKRIKELQIIFDSPDRYGKGLDWTGYTVHDAANILRRYLTHLPQPIIPLGFYEQFREPLRSHQTQAVGDMEAQAQDLGDFDHHNAITTYQRLITELPPLNRQLLLYILDLLSVFASKSDINLMTSANLAAIFQPGLLSHPTHDMRPQEYRLSQDVLIFLIDNQDSFLIGMSGTAADEKTVKEVQSGASTRHPNTPTSTRNSQSGLGRSVSNASAGTDSLRRLGGIRRNVSVSSKNSTNLPSPATPSSGATYTGNNPASGVHRSNTMPSKKSPGLSSTRFNQPLDSPTSQTGNYSSGGLLSPAGRSLSPGSPVSRLARNAAEPQIISQISTVTRSADQSVAPAATGGSEVKGQSKERLISENQWMHLPPPLSHNEPTPTKERKISSLFSKSPTGDTERSETRQPNKLRKKRIPSSTNPSAHSSTHSLHQPSDSPSNQAFYTPMVTPGVNAQADPISTNPLFSNTVATPVSENSLRLGYGSNEASLLQSADTNYQNPGLTLRPEKSPTPSMHSRTSLTDYSEPEHNDDATTRSEKEAKKRHWRFSSAKKNGQASSATLPANPSHIGSNAVANMSTSSIGSWARPRKSITNDTHQTVAESSVSGISSSTPAAQHSSNETGQSREVTREKEGSQDASEKKGPITWLKNKVAQAKEERKEREAEKERNKSPPRSNAGEVTGSKQSLSAMAQDMMPHRGRSMDAKRDDRMENELEPPLPTTNTNANIP